MLITTERQPRIRGEEEADRCLRGLATFCSKIRQLLERKSGRLAGWRASSVLYTRGRCGGTNYRDTWRRNLPNDSSSDSPSNNKEIIPRRDNFLSLSCDYIHRTCSIYRDRYVSTRDDQGEQKLSRRSSITSRYRSSPPALFSCEPAPDNESVQHSGGGKRRRLKEREGGETSSINVYECTIRHS